MSHAASTPASLNPSSPIVFAMAMGAWMNGNACVWSNPCFPKVPRIFPSLSWRLGMLVLRTQTSSGSTDPSPTNTMLLTNVQYGSTTEIRLISASSKSRP